MTEPSLPEESIFAQALEIAPTAERLAFLDQACGNNQALRAEVEALLRASERSGDLLDLPENPVLTTDLPVHERPGTVIGPYKLLEQIGEGGMGTVWMAEQTEPIQRRVAVKVVKEGVGSRQVLARFEAERQALALMEHPNIAKILDAGRTPSGRPYFVMELVKGQPITRHCDEKRLGVRERLDLFGDVCRAVQHAHQKGIIHRDVKPSNVLAAPYDGKLVVKVIDFGVAKATGQRLTDKTLFTGFGALVGTPEYMSPEQAEVNNQDIDTRSDIYSLGVLLYELLTGSTPLTRKRVKEEALLEVLRVIREEEPPRPSTRLSESTGSLPSISAQRQTEPGKLTKMVRGELDWIVMKALEKDRNRRYDTANGFAADVQRYLADEPVQACPPSAGYRLRKFARRNKAGLATAGLILLFLVVLGSGVGWVTWDRSAKQRETERGATAALAQAEVFLTEGDKETDNPARWQATVGLAEAAVQRAEELLALGKATADLAERVRQVREGVTAARADSELLAEVERIALEKAAVKQGNFDVARAAPRYATLLRGYGVNPAAPEEAAARVRHSRVREALLSALEDWWRVTPDAAEQQQLAAVLQAAEPAPDAFRMRWEAAARRRDGATLTRMAGEPGVQKLPATAVVYLARDLGGVKEYAAQERLLRAAQQRHRSNFWLNHELGMLLLVRKPPRPEEAVAYLTAALALRTDSPGVYLNLGKALHDKKDLEGAIRAYQAALRIDPNYAMAHSNLGLALNDKKDLEGAIRECRAAITIDPGSAMAHSNLGLALRDQKDLEGAIRECRAALQIDPNFAGAHNNLGLALHDKKDLEGAIREYQAAITIDPGSAMAHSNLGSALRAKKDLEGAIRECQVAITIDPNYAPAHNNLGNALLDQKDLEGAIREYQAAITIDPNDALPHVGLGSALAAKKDLEGAIREYQAAITIDPNFAGAHSNLGLALRDKKDLEGAIRECKAALRIDPNFAGAHNNLGLALHDKKDLEGAIREFQAALAIDPNYAMAHYNLGIILSEQKDLAGAIREFQVAIKIDPNLAQAHAELGAVLLVHKKDLEGAIRECQAALAIDPDHARVHLCVGEVLRQRKDLAGAIREYQVAISTVRF